jgi:hypothetical protein
VPSPDPDTYLAAPPGPWTGPVPVPDIDSEEFFAGLRRHRLEILRCEECRQWVHPPQASCPRCLSLRLTTEPVSGRGVVYSYTLANREFAPGVKPPYAAALVDLEEQESLRVVTTLVNLRVGDVRIGLPVRVVYRDIRNDLGDEATLAFFEPDPESPS